MTIDELMEGKQPGEIKLQYEEDLPSITFTPYFRDHNGHWHGLNGDEVWHYFMGTEEGWSLYIEPKPKVKKYLWALPSGYIGDRFLADSEVLDEHLIKLPWSEMEFDE